ncbi:hypothetical protein XENOCAPTIV_024639 [Xenoophorus captivus]|uniref:Uncharacterized protein n=1 Tax=Xenoophorus captivus TaxID=1517983 RepID=A0ABV0QL80_9TELE
MIDGFKRLRKQRASPSSNTRRLRSVDVDLESNMIFFFFVAFKFRFTQRATNYNDADKEEIQQGTSSYYQDKMCSLPMLLVCTVLKSRGSEQIPEEHQQESYQYLYTLSSVGELVSRPNNGPMLKSLCFSIVSKVLGSSIKWLHCVNY